jgi:hypothetical protein
LQTDVPAVYPRVAQAEDKKSNLQACRESPLTDSNRRPPPYHLTAVGNPAPSAFTNGSHFLVFSGPSCRDVPRFSGSCTRLVPAASAGVPVRAGRARAIDAQRGPFPRELPLVRGSGGRARRPCRTEGCFGIVAAATLRFRPKEGRPLKSSPLCSPLDAVLQSFAIRMVDTC